MSQTIKNYDKEAIKRADSAHHFHPFTDSKGLDDEGGARIIVRGEGCYLYDIDGEKILDGMAGLWCTNIGYGRAELGDLAAEQMKELAYYNTFFKTTTAPAALLAEKVASLLPDNMNHVFFANSGSEANDTNLRLARTYWQHVGQPSKKIIISRNNAYHGSTVAGASLGGMSGMHNKQASLEISGIEHVMQPYWYVEGGDMTEDDFGIHAAREVEKKILEVGADNVAAFIGEPIQGAGGVIVPPKTYWPEINRICKEHNILLICDEVICGFGRTGNWFGHQTFGIEPDILTMAKGLSSGYLPISASGVSDRVWDAFYVAGDDFNHGYTYSGHPVASVVALRNIEIMEEEKLIEKVQEETGPYLAKRLAELNDHSIVGETRCVGLVCAIELTNDKEKRTRFPNEGRAGTICRDNFFKRNVIMRACGDVMVSSPPLIATKEDIDLLIDTARECLDATAKELGMM